jgi:hypothetical protein
MTSTNFVFLLAIVTLASLLGFWIWQLRKVRKEKRRGDEEKLTRVAEERY